MVQVLTAPSYTSRNSFEDASDCRSFERRALITGCERTWTLSLLGILTTEMGVVKDVARGKRGARIGRAQYLNAGALQLSRSRHESAPDRRV